MIDIGVLVLTVIVVGLIAFGLGTFSGLMFKKTDGQALSWESPLLPIGVPFKIICRPTKLPNHALIQFFAEQGVLFIELPQTGHIMDFAPGSVLSKMEVSGQPVLQTHLPQPITD